MNDHQVDTIDSTMKEKITEAVSNTGIGINLKSIKHINPRSCIVKGNLFDVIIIKFETVMYLYLLLLQSTTSK
jgi:hypothetical protein